MAREKSGKGTQTRSSPERLRPADAGIAEREFEAMMFIGTRNLDAACSMNRLVIDCIEQCAERQAEVWGNISTSALSMLGIFGQQTQGDTPTVRNSSVIADTVELMLRHMRQVSQIIARTNDEALDLISSRAGACFKEAEEAANRNILTMMESVAHPAASLTREASAPSKRSDTSGKT